MVNTIETIWNEHSLAFNMVVFCILKFIFTVLSLSLPCPSGIFSPLICIGSVFGRFYGVLLTRIGRYYFGIDILQHEGLFGVIGAAGLFASSTKTISPAIIFFEFTGQTTNLQALLICVLTANLTAASRTKSIFDVIYEFRKLPYLPALGDL